MKDFKNYSGEPGSGDTPANSNQSVNNTVELAKVISKAMNGKNQAQVMRVIISEAERGKREGRLTNSDLDNFYNTIYPMLDGAKRQKLTEVIEKLKKL